jgi:hypothetical protein
MLKKLNCVNYEPINQFTRIYTSETSVGFPFNLYFVIPSIGCTQDILAFARRMVSGVNSGSVILKES